MIKMKENNFLNEHWHYKVSFAFRDALDIKFTEKVKDRESSKEWTQGVYLNFKEGDTLHSKNKKKCIQIIRAIPAKIYMGEYQEGTVVYYEYNIDERGRYTLVNIDKKKHLSQKEFLYYLITGVKNG